jgi:hypothetical protein
MATQRELSATVTYEGVTWTITAKEEESGGVAFEIQPDQEGAGDIRGLFLDLSDDRIGPIATNGLQKDTTAADGWLWYQDNEIVGADISQVQWGENLVDDLGSGANIKGNEPGNQPPEGYPGPDIFDLGLEFGGPGAGQNDADFINRTSFTIQGITLADLANQFFGLRLTSTAPNRTGSLKLVGQFTAVDDHPTLYQGFSRGSWLFGVRSGDDLKDLFSGEPFKGTVPTYEELFLKADTELTFTSTGRNGDFFTNPTLKQALGLNGGGLNQFAAQSTAAYLNARYLQTDGDPLTAYSLTKSVVKELTASVLNGGQLGGSVDLSKYWWYEDTNGVKGFQEAGEGGDTIVYGSAGMGMKELTSLFDFYNNFGTDPAGFMLTPPPPPLLV